MHEQKYVLAHSFQISDVTQFQDTLVIATGIRLEITYWRYGMGAFVEHFKTANPIIHTRFAAAG